MKHLKKLSVVLMMTILFSVSFTSCIDNEVSPLVEAIYEAQADLIAAQANVQNAEAALLLAQVQSEEANAALLEAQAAQVAALTAGIEEGNAYAAAQHVQDLLVLAAQTSLNVAALQNELELAQVEFETQMAAAIAAMEAAGAQLAADYASDYSDAMWDANWILSQKLTAEASLAQAMLMQTGGVSWEYYLAQLEGAVATAEANKADLETAIADMEAYIANPSTPEAMVSGLNADKEALQAQYDAKVIEMQVQLNKIMAIYDENDVRDEIDVRIFEALDYHNFAVNEKNDRLDWIEAAEMDIAAWQLALDDYPAALAAFELAVSDAQTALDNAELALIAANEAKWASDDVLADADADLLAAQNALADLNAALALLDASYQDAIANYAAEQAAYDAGLPAAEADLLAAQNALIAGNAAVTLAQADYDAKLAVFEADPAGVTWFAGADGLLGNHADGALMSKIYIVTNNLATANATGTSTVAVGTSPITGAAIALADIYDATFNNTGAAGDYYNFETDDISVANSVLLDASVVTLTAAQAVIPALQLAVDNAQDFVDNFGDDLDAAYAIFLEQKNLYDNQLALVVTAEAVVDAADAAQIAAADANAAAILAVTAASNAEIAAVADLATAEADLAAFELTTEEDLQLLIDAELVAIADWNTEIAAIQPIIDAQYAVVASLLGELTAAGIEYTFVVETDGTGTLVITNYGYLSSLYPDLEAQIIAEWQVYWVLEQELTAIDNALALNDALISAYSGYDDLDDLAAELSDLQDDLAAANVQIELATQALATAQVEEMAAEAYITYLEALVTTLEQEYANALAIAAKYKALMDAALAS